MLACVLSGHAQFSTDRAHIHVSLNHTNLQGFIPLSNPNAMRVLTEETLKNLDGDSSTISGNDLRTLRNTDYILASDTENIADTLGPWIHHRIDDPFSLSISGDYTRPHWPINLVIGYAYRDVPNTNTALFDQRLVPLEFDQDRTSFVDDVPTNYAPILPSVDIQESQWHLGVRRYVDINPTFALYYGLGNQTTQLTLRGHYVANGRQYIHYTSEIFQPETIQSEQGAERVPFSSTATMSQLYLETAGLYRLANAMFISLAARYQPETQIQLPVGDQMATLTESSMHYTLSVGYAL